MGCRHMNLICLHHFPISFTLILLISTSSHLRLLNAEGRKLEETAECISKRTLLVLKEEKAMLRAAVGSRPPRCDRRCSSCAHCEAIQVPTNPSSINNNNFTAAPLSATYSVINISRSDDSTSTSSSSSSSNYKPMSWKCKCGDLIFNP